jgi:hypothetical protein
MGAYFRPSSYPHANTADEVMTTAPLGDPAGIFIYYSGVIKSLRACRLPTIFQVMQLN